MTASMGLLDQGYHLNYRGFLYAFNEEGMRIVRIGAWFEIFGRHNRLHNKLQYLTITENAKCAIFADSSYMRISKSNNTILPNVLSNRKVDCIVFNSSLGPSFTLNWTIGPLIQHLLLGFPSSLLEIPLLAHIVVGAKFSLVFNVSGFNALTVMKRAWVAPWKILFFTIA